MNLHVVNEKAHKNIHGLSILDVSRSRQHFETATPRLQPRVQGMDGTRGSRSYGWKKAKYMVGVNTQIHGDMGEYKRYLF